MNVLSLFDGMSCGQIALTELGIKIDSYFASEIDTHAIKQTQLNFPDTIQLGDVTKWREWPINWSQINLIGAGSPCQGFSFAGKQLAFDDPRSKLFFVFVEILNHCKKFNPDVKFLLENVDMKKDHLRVISEYVGVFPVNINSNLVSAQNRNRWYWTNIRTKKVGLFDEVYTDIPQPKDEGILLRDILESEVKEKYFVSDKAIERCNRRKWSKPQLNPDKTGCIGTTNNSGRLGVDAGTTFISVDGKAPNQRSSTGRSLDKKHNYQVIQLNTSLESGGKQPYQQNRVYDITGIAPCLSIDTRSPSVIIQNGHGFNKGGIHEEKSPTMTSNSFEHNNHVFNNSRIRRLTPTECARLQTVPSWYRWNCSDTQQYRMLGNGWTCKIISHILSFMK